MNKRFSIPSKFFLTEEKNLNNPNFHPVKLRIMSSGKNWNGSDFSIESLDLAKDTVSYSPILANIVERNDGELDANGHDIDFEMKIDYQGNVSFKETYVERAVGVFLNNSCEKKYDEENDVYYLEAYGYIWKVYSEIYNVLKRDEVKDVSVEIEVLDGEFAEDGYYKINQYNVLGCTILGNGNLPAIDNSRIEFSVKNDREYGDYLKQLNILLENFSKGGGTSIMDENKIIEEFVEEEVPQEEEVCPECGKTLDECTCDEEEEFAKDEEKEEEEEVCPECGKTLDECECDEEKEKEFAEEDEEEEEKVCEECGKPLDECKCDEEKEKEKCAQKKLYSQSELDEAIAKTRDEFAQAMEELKALREFKANYDKQIELQKLNEEMDRIIANFNVNDELVEKLKEKVIDGEYSMERFELELFRNNSPKKESKKEDKQVKLPIVDKEEKLSDVDRFFSRHGVPKRKQ